MSGFTAQANFTFNSPGQRVFIDTLAERETASFNNPQNKRADVTPVKSHVSLILRKLVIIFLFILIAILGLTSTIIGTIAQIRNCYSPRQPSISIWLLVLGGMSILLVSVLTLLILLSTTCKYKSSDKKFRVAFIITIGIATSLLGWANAPGTQAAFNLPNQSLICLGFIYNYSTALYFILIICSFICTIYAVYKNRHRCCRGKKNENKIGPTHLLVVNQVGVIQAIPFQHCIPQLVPLQNPTIVDTHIEMIPTEVDISKEKTSIESAPIDTKTNMTAIENIPVDARKENTSIDNRKEPPSTKTVPADVKIEINSTGKDPISS